MGSGDPVFDAAMERLLIEPLPVQGGELWRNINTRESFHVVDVEVRRDDPARTYYIVILDSGTRWEINQFLAYHVKVQ